MVSVLSIDPVDAFAAAPETEVPSLLEATEQAWALAAAGQMPIIDLFNAAQRLTEVKHPDIALALYRLWLERTASPLAYAVQFNVAVILSNMNDDAGAEVAYRAAIAQNASFSQAHLNLGTLLERNGRVEEALDAWRAVLSCVDRTQESGKSFYIQALNNLGRLMEVLKRLPEAEAMLEASLRAAPEQPKVMTHWVHIRQKQCAWPVYSETLGIAMDDMLAGTSALAMLSASDDPARQLAAATRFVEDKVLRGARPMTARRSYGHERLRIGYLSSDFCSHAVSILTAELYGLHDRSKVEVFGFCWSREDGSPLRARVIAGMDHHVRIGALSDEEAARLIRSHEIDILVDLHGLTQGTRHDILSHRPAPLQIAWLGFPGTTGLPEIDYVVSDRFVLPPELERFFTEKPLHMPQTFQINDSLRAIGPRPSKEACGLPRDAFVFCSFNNNFKFNPEMFGAWMRILARTPDSILWLVADSDGVRVNLRAAAAAHGIACERLYFAERVPPADYLARYQQADLFLDTFPFGGGTTASDALWAGLPLLTYTGHVFASRMAGSLLNAVNLPELITYSLQEYEDKAVALAHDRPRVEAMKLALEENRLTCPLFDSRTFVHELEAAYRKLVDQLPLPVSSPSVSADLSYLRAPSCDPEGRRYVIVAPPFRHNSAGIRVLYELQKWLVCAGLDAIVCTYCTGYPVEQFIDDIVIYPEVAPGNLLNARRVVRYLLNVPGKLAGGDKTYDPNELLVAYNPELAHLANGVMLEVPSIEPFFNSLGASNTGNAVFVGKGRDLGLHPSDCIAITKAYPTSRRAVADLLRATKTLYMYDDFSMISREATNCGCDVKLIRKDGAVVDYPKASPTHVPTLEQFKVQLHDFIALSKNL